MSVAEALTMYEGTRIERILMRASAVERIDIPGKGHVLNLYHPDGIELNDFLDSAHMPRITNFKTVVLYPALANIRDQLPRKTDLPGVEVQGGDRAWLQTISDVARRGTGYDIDSGQTDRKTYYTAMVAAMRLLYEQEPLRNEVVLGVERCGGNLARALSIGNLFVDAKRLRFKDDLNLLGAGINLPQNASEIVDGRRVRLVEGVLASGSTVGGFFFAFRNEGISVLGVDCDAVIACPAGLIFTAELRRAIGDLGHDRRVYTGGILDKDWYVRYHQNDPLLPLLGSHASEFVGEQVLGDGGDLTSNL